MNPVVHFEMPYEDQECMAGQPDDIPGIGLYCSFIDTEGNRVGMLQPAPMPSQPK